MKELIIKIVLSVCSAFLMIGIIAAMFMEDHTAPEIRIAETEGFTYNEREGEAALLRGVTAFDDRDGDVTESVRVSGVFKISGNRAIVNYAAKDSSNNVGNMKREVVCIDGEVKKETETAVKAEETQTAAEPEETDLPQIVMLQNELTLKVGERFNILRYIEGATDVDGSDLSRKIHVEGDYDTAQPGVYTLSVYAVGAQGTRSNTETLTLTIEAE